MVLQREFLQTLWSAALIAQAAAPSAGARIVHRQPADAPVTHGQ